jgi:hypothetical protein
MLERWSQYVIGILIGLLNIGSLLVSKKPPECICQLEVEDFLPHDVKTLPEQA